jgi:uncharacterized protein (DUF927 family)
MIDGRTNPDRSAEEVAREETERKAELFKWADDLAHKVIEAVKADVAFQFLEGDADDDEQLSTLDLAGDYDPIVDEAAGVRLSDAIRHAAERFRLPGKEKALRQIYDSALRRKWRDEDHQLHSELKGTEYGRSYMTTRHGVWFRLNVGGIEELAVWRRIAKTRVDLEALSHDTTPQLNYRLRVLVTGEDIGQIAVDIPAEYLGRDAHRAIVILKQRGVHVVESKEARSRLAKFLQRRPRKRIVRAPSTGWFERPRGHWVFVLPDEVLGATNKTNIILDGVTGGSGYGFRRSRSVGEWGTHVAIPLARNSNAVLAVGMMLAAPLLRWADEPGGGFHFYGFSKAGKTLVMAIGQSVWGRPFIPGSGDANAFGYDWDSTSARLEERAVLRNDVGLSLDGIEGGNIKAIASSVYTLASGQGRGRMRQREAAFNVMLLSTGEISVAQLLGDERAGRLVRLSDIPAEVASGTAFETFRPDAAGQQFYPAVRENHGEVGYVFLKYLVDQTPKKFKPRLDAERKAFLAQPAVAEIHERAHPQVISVINRFALVYAALVMGISAQILPWSLAEINAGVTACMQRWLNQRGNIDTAAELVQKIDRIRRAFAVTVSDRLIRLTSGRGRIVPASPADQSKMDAMDAANQSKTGAADLFDGYVKDGRILLLPEAWERLWHGLDRDEVKKYLLNRGWLILGPGGKASISERVKSGEPTVRVYELAPSFIE